MFGKKPPKPTLEMQINAIVSAKLRIAEGALNSQLQLAARSLEEQINSSCKVIADDLTAQLNQSEEKNRKALNDQLNVIIKNVKDDNDLRADDLEECRAHREMQKLDMESAKAWRKASLDRDAAQEKRQLRMNGAQLDMWAAQVKYMEALEARFKDLIAVLSPAKPKKRKK